MGYKRTDRKKYPHLCQVLHKLLTHMFYILQDDEVCGLCSGGARPSDTDDTWAGCDGCTTWYHKNCLHPADRISVSESILNDTDWLCMKCK